MSARILEFPEIIIRRAAARRAIAHLKYLLSENASQGELQAVLDAYAQERREAKAKHTRTADQNVRSDE